ncbi:hypothetical protein IRJ41_010557, partial [Triplophysa rosa]
PFGEHIVFQLRTHTQSEAFIQEQTRQQKIHMIQNVFKNFRSNISQLENFR